MSSHESRTRWFRVAVLCALGSGCAQGPSPLSTGEAFVAIPRSASGPSFATGQVSPDGSEFYLALKRSELGQRYFFSATVTQYVEHFLDLGIVQWGLPAPLVTAIVTFQIHDGRLYVVDASKFYDFSDTLDPTVVIDSYAIVDDPTFDRMEGHEGYVLIDPAGGYRLRYADIAPLLPFGSVLCPTCADRFTIDLSFAQNFRKTTDGVLFDQVFSGTVSAQLGQRKSDVKASGTLGISLHRHSEGAGFTPSYPASRPYFFVSNFVPIPNASAFALPLLKWNIHPGMSPIRWIVSDEVNRDPFSTAQGGLYDIAGALQQGIEDWNAAFGFPVFQASIGPIADAMADDTVSKLVWDVDSVTPFSFMSATFNPDTGEIRAGYVYVPQTVVALSDAVASVDGLALARLEAALRLTAPLPAWAERSSLIGCILPIHGAGGLAGALDAAPRAPIFSGTKKELVEGVIRTFARHESGHALGLRHNFEGSLSIGPGTLSSSIMDYPTFEDGAELARSGPGAYDAAVVRFLYGLGPEPASMAFCTDEDLSGPDPNCNQWDRGSDPLHDWFASNYNDLLAGTPLSGTPVVFGQDLDYFLNRVLQYVRAGADLTTRSDAWDIAFSPARTPEGDALAQHIFARLYLDTPDLRGFIVNDPPSDVTVAAVIPDLEKTLVDADHIRSYATRRTCVDALKHVQLVEALEALRAARDAIAASRATLSGDDAVLTDDLLARIDAAIQPYFR
jgi:hypothetical protein